jgi:hypothetical protein
VYITHIARLLPDAVGQTVEVVMSEIPLSNVATQSGRRSFIGDSDARVIGIGTDQLAARREKRGGAEPEGLSGKPPPSEGSANPVGAAHSEFVAALAGHPPRTIPLDADALDLEDRGDHLGEVFAALSVYVALILDDTAQNAPGRLDLRDAEAVLADLASDLTGAIQRAADDMAGRPA